jgi:uncharacterized membrane protein
MPIVVIALCQALPLLGKLGVVVCSFAIGISIAMGFDLNSLPQAITIRSAQSTVTELSIALALPLLLFTIDLKSSLKLAGSTLKALSIAFSSIVIISIIGAVVFHGSLDNISDLSGMLVGAYTGGGPNMVSVKAAINADEQLFLTMVTYDIVFSTLYLLLIITIGKTLFRKWLPPYTTNTNNAELKAEMEEISDETAFSYNRLLNLSSVGQTVCALICSIIVVAIAISLAKLLPESMQGNGIIILITTLGLTLSFVPKVRNLKNGFRLGMYLILVFCFTSGTMIDQNVLSNINPALAAYISFVLIGSLMVQVIAGKLLNIDADTSIVASSAAVLSVPLIPIVSSALNNKDILVPGYAAGITGYAVGNYLGIFVANFTSWLLA